MKTFNFELSNHCKPRLKWLKENCNQKISQDEFLKHWQELRIFSKSKRNNPSRAKKVYRNLKNNFGFFN